MFGFLKKKIKEFITGTKEEIKKEEEKEEQEIKQEIKEIEKTEKQILKEDKEIKELEEKKEGLFSKLKKVFTTKLDEQEFNKLFDKLEIILIENNVALEAIDSLREKLKNDLINKEISRKEWERKIEESLKQAIDSLFIEPFDLIDKIKTEKQKPFIIVFFGINGSGKTTTIAKIAYMLKNNNITSVFAAADTFRAASIEQLEKHGSKLGIEVIKQKYGSDPAAVAFDAIAHAKAKAIDVVLIDTAGRMHTKHDLLREMEKICRVTKPQLKIFVGEAITGNDVIEQAKAFNDAIGIDAIILTKADVDEKGGATISISHVTKKPILFLGVGQEYDNLKKFDKKEIINKIFG